MKDFISLSLRMAILLVFGITTLCGYAGGSTRYYHFINVRSCDSAKGLVYADTVAIKGTPDFSESVDLKWVDEIYDPDDELDDHVYTPMGIAQPKDGYLFTGWSQNLVSAKIFSFDNPVYFETYASNTSLDDENDFPEEPDDVFYAHFGKVACAVDADSKKNNLGAVSISNPDNMPGDEVILTATPWADNVSLKTWLKDGVAYSSENPLRVIAQEQPSTFYAVFDTKNDVEYNFDSHGEWKLHYNRSMDAHLPSSADCAYIIPKDKLNNSSYCVLAVDTLKAGTVYLVHGSGPGTIEYFNHDAATLPEIESPLRVAEDDLEIHSTSIDAYFLIDLATLNFKRAPYGQYTIPAGSGYMQIDVDDSEEIKYLGVINPTLDYLIDSYHYVDYASVHEGTEYGPKYLSMTYNKYRGHYEITKFFDYDKPQISADLIPGSLTDIEIPIMRDFLEFNNTLAESDEEIAADGCRLLTVWEPLNIENSNLNLTVMAEGGNGKYTMTPFSIYIGHSNMGEWREEYTDTFNKIADITDINIRLASDVPEDNISLDYSEIDLFVGDTFTLTATVSSNDGNAKSVIWTSSNPSVASVDDNGNITGRSSGKAIIAATYGNATATCKVNVDYNYVTEIHLDQTELTLTVDETAMLNVTYIPDNAQVKDVIWSSTDESVATVVDGLILAKGVGEADIIAESVFSDGSVTATCHVTVLPIEAERIILDQELIELVTGETAHIEATVLPENATDKTVTWTSSNPEIVSVDQNGNILAGNMTGYAVITATCGNASATCAVLVDYKKITEIQFDKTELILKVGDVANINVTYFPDDAFFKELMWESKDESVATVLNGEVYAVGVGETDITATALMSEGLVTATCHVTVLPIEAERIVLDQELIELVTGETAHIEATVLPENATDKTVTWTSSNPEIVSVDQNGNIQAGTLTGYAVITATCGNASATCAVLVDYKKITEIQFDKTELILKVGDVANINVTYFPDDAFFKELMWESKDESVATVLNGEVYAVGVGETDITAMALVSEGRVTATCHVTVLPVEAELVILNVYEVTLKPTENMVLTATVLPDNTTDATVTWSSSDDTIATVDATGLVTAISTGNAVITASCGAASAACYVNVETGDGINDIIIDSLDAPTDIYTVQGVKVRSHTTDLGGLPRGFYIINGQKRYVK